MILGTDVSFYQSMVEAGKPPALNLPSSALDKTNGKTVTLPITGSRLIG